MTPGVSIVNFEHLIVDWGSFCPHFSYNLQIISGNFRFGINMSEKQLI